jgi:S1-C subfamily serine protease
MSVLSGSGAEKAGMRSATRDRNGDVVLGDVIVGVDGKPVEKTGDLFAALEPHNVGDQVTVTVLRGGDRVDLDVTLGKLER